MFPFFLHFLVSLRSYCFDGGLPLVFKKDFHFPVAKEDVIIFRTEPWRKSRDNKEQPFLRFFSQLQGYFHDLGNLSVNVVTTGLPHLAKARVTPLCSHERPTLVPASANRKKPKRIRASRKRGEKRNSARCWFCGEPSERRLAPGHAPAPEGPLSSVSAPGSRAPTCACAVSTWASFQAISLSQSVSSG